MPVTSLDIAYILGLSNTDPNFIPLTADMSSATWNADATHEILTVTGVNHIKIVAFCSDDLTSGGAAVLTLGTETDADAWITATGFDLLNDGTLWFSDTPAAYSDMSTVVFDKIVYDEDVGYEVDTAALTGGTLQFGMWWAPISPGAAVVVGAGGVLA